MLTGIARDELRKLLKFSEEKDLKIIGLKIIPGIPRSDEKTEIIEEILSCASQPSGVLRQQRLRKRIMRRYLWGCGIVVTQEQSKVDYIRICLDMWQVKDDDYLWKFLTDEEIQAKINRFEENMKQSLQELKHRIRQHRPSVKELRDMIKSMDKIFLTINSIGTPSPSPSTQGSTISSTLSSEDDYDSSSSLSSVEIIEESANAGPASSQVPLSVNPSETSSSPLLSSVNTSEHPLPKLETSSNNVEPSTSQGPSSMNTFQPLSSQIPSSMDILEPAPPNSPISVPFAETTASPTRTVQPTRRSKSSMQNTRSPSSRKELRSRSGDIAEPIAPRDVKQLYQTALPNFFRVTRSPSLPKNGR